jgi:transcriptional regulator with XRE-family HTH domain
MTHQQLTQTWGANVREERTKQGLTLMELCRRADLDPGNLSRFERGLQGSTDEFRMAIARALRMPMDELFPYPDTSRP